MHPRLKDSLSLLQKAGKITPINKGFSNDQKYNIDDMYLLRVFDNEHAAARLMEFETIRKIAAFSVYVPDAIMFQEWKDCGLACMVLTYLPGEDGEVVLPHLSAGKQYQAGFHAGAELNKMHQLKAPANLPSWDVRKKQKSDRYLDALAGMEEVDLWMKDMLTSYIRKNEYLLHNRPQTILHDDFHPANLLIHQGEFSGIIDFQRMDWGDPVHDFYKLGFFSSRISKTFTRGIIDGYHEKTGVTISFWKLYALYSAMHIVSALVWGEKIGNFSRMLNFSKAVLQDHADFRQEVPAWYL